MKKGLCFMGMLLAGLAAGTALLFAVFLLPAGRMAAHVRESEQMLRYEFDNGDLIYGYPFTLTGLFTDCIMLQNAVYEGGNHGLTERVMEVYRQDMAPDAWAPGEALSAYVNGEELPCEVSYGRYWHGYLVFLKPLLLIFNVSELRLLLTVSFGVSCMALVWGFYRRGMMRHGMAFLSALILMMPLSMLFSLSLSVCFYIMAAGLLLMLYQHEKLENWGYAFFFLTLGMVTSYLDFLTYPLVTLGMPLVLWLALTGRGRGAGKYAGGRLLRGLSANGAAWAVGYGVMWAGKWVISDALLGTGVIRDALSTLSQRTGVGESRFGEFAMALRSNLGVYRNWPCALLALGAAVLLGLWWRKLRKENSRGSVGKAQSEAALSGAGEEIGGAALSGAGEEIGGAARGGAGEGFDEVPGGKAGELPGRARAAAYVCLMLLPFGWFFAATNHSAEHWMFTFRILGITVWAVLCLLLELRESRKQVRKDRLDEEI